MICVIKNKTIFELDIDFQEDAGIKKSVEYTMKSTMSL